MPMLSFSNIKILFFLTIFFVAIFLILYLWQINMLVSQTYLRNSLLEKIQSLSQQNKELEFIFLQKSSLGILEDKISQLPFEKSGQINYIKMLEGVVVKSSGKAYGESSP